MHTFPICLCLCFSWSYSLTTTSHFFTLSFQTTPALKRTVASSFRPGASCRNTFQKAIHQVGLLLCTHAQKHRNSVKKFKCLEGEGKGNNLSCKGQVRSDPLKGSKDLPQSNPYKDSSVGCLDWQEGHIAKLIPWDLFWLLPVWVKGRILCWTVIGHLQSPVCVLSKPNCWSGTSATFAMFPLPLSLAIYPPHFVSPPACSLCGKTFTRRRQVSLWVEGTLSCQAWCYLQTLGILGLLIGQQGVVSLRANDSMHWSFFPVQQICIRCAVALCCGVCAGLFMYGCIALVWPLYPVVYSLPVLGSCECLHWAEILLVTCCCKTDHSLASPRKPLPATLHAERVVVWHVCCECNRVLTPLCVISATDSPADPWRDPDALQMHLGGLWQNVHHC